MLHGHHHKIKLSLAYLHMSVRKNGGHIALIPTLPMHCKMYVEGAGRLSGIKRWTGDRLVQGSNPAAAICFGTLAISFTPLCQCLSEETLKAVGFFYLLSMPGDVIDHTSPHWNV